MPRTTSRRAMPGGGSELRPGQPRDCAGSGAQASSSRASGAARSGKPSGAAGKYSRSWSATARRCGYAPQISRRCTQAGTLIPSSAGLSPRRPGDTGRHRADQVSQQPRIPASLFAPRSNAAPGTGPSTLGLIAYTRHSAAAIAYARSSAHAKWSSWYLS